MSVEVPLSPTEMQDLLASADRRGLLDDSDLGAKVYDAGALQLTITVDGRTHQLELSGGSSTLTETQRAARDSFTAFVAEVAAAIR